MKKIEVLALGACVIVALASCKSSESAYKKAYEKAKQQELAVPVEERPQVVETAEIPLATTPVVSTPAPVAPKVVDTTGIRQEKVSVVSGSDVKDFNVVCGSFGLKTNAEGLRDFLVSEGYNPVILFNAQAAMYRVVVSTYSDRSSAAQARDAFKAKYPQRKDFQGAWLLYRVF